MKSQRAEKILCITAFVMIFLFTLSIGVGTFTRQILVKRMGITNAFTDYVLFGARAWDAESDDAVTVDWAARYPFSESETTMLSSQDVQDEQRKMFDYYEKRIHSVESAIGTYTTDLLIGYDVLVDLAKDYERFVRWNYVSYAEYNGVVKLDDGYLTSYIESQDATAVADSTKDLAEFCLENGAAFLYIQAPYKICRQDGVSGTIDFSNQNADAFLSRLQAAGVDTFDLREKIHEENLQHHALFYRTDHHWRAETGLWAARLILEFLSKQYGYSIDPSALAPDRFSSVDYPAWFLGSQGKKVKLEATTPDDFALLYPDYPTELHFAAPDKGIDAVGDFSITYDMEHVSVLDYYNKSPYHAYNYGDRPLVEIENNLIADNGKILLIHDSFSDCVISFLALGMKNVAAIDLRHFTGSVRRYIETERPDMVIVLYNPGAIRSKIDFSTHKDQFDFR